MQNVMLIDNVSYALWEIDAPVFILKSDIEKSLQESSTKGVGATTLRKAMEFNGKYYGYTRVHPPETAIFASGSKPVEETKTDKDEI